MDESLEKCVITSPIPAGVVICPHMKDYEKIDLLLCTASTDRLFAPKGIAEKLLMNMLATCRRNRHSQ